MLGEGTVDKPDSVRGFRSSVWLGSVLILCALLPVLWSAELARHGFDFTDEGFYLNWIAAPFLYPVSATQFGYVYHPMYWLLDGNIWGLRVANVLITFFLSCTGFALVSWSKSEPLDQTGVAIGTTASFATSSLAFAAFGLLTPSYNSLTLQALLLTAIGLLLSASKWKEQQILAAMAIGAGGALCFLAKPPSAVALAPLVLLMLWVRGSHPLRCAMRSILVACITLAAVALVIDGSLWGFKDRLVAAFELTRELDGYQAHQILRLDELVLTDMQRTFAMGAGFTALVVGILARWLEVPTSFYGLALAALSLLIVVGWADVPLDHGPFIGSVFFGVTAVYGLLGVVLLLASDSSVKQKFCRLLTALGLSIFPWISALGTNNNQWLLMGSAAVFWLLAAHVLVSGGRRSPTAAILQVSIALTTPFICTAVLSVSTKVPYRQPPDSTTFQTSVSLISGEHRLLMQRDFAEYISEVRSNLSTHGFAPGIPMVDLTGQSPGLLFWLGAKAIGSPWLIGGYPWSEKLAQDNLRYAACQARQAAWLIEEPDGPRSLPASILWGESVELSQHYDSVFELETPVHAGGYLERRRQVFWRPKLGIATRQICSEEGEHSTPQSIDAKNHNDEK